MVAYIFIQPPPQKNFLPPCYEHICLYSNNLNGSFLSESSDTLNDDLVQLTH